MKEVDDNFTLKNKSIQWTSLAVAWRRGGHRCNDSWWQTVPQTSGSDAEGAIADDATTQNVVASRRCLPQSADHVLGAALYRADNGRWVFQLDLTRP